MSKKYIFAQTIFTHFWGQYLKNKNHTSSLDNKNFNYNAKS